MRSPLALLLALALCACSRQPSRLPIAVLVRAEAKDAAAIRAALAREQAEGVEIRWVDLPAVPPPARSRDADVEVRLSRARKAYTVPDVPGCLAELGDDDLVPSLLDEGNRAAAGRVLFWRIACLVAGGSLAEAQRAAAAFAAHDLEVPRDVDAASPEAQAVLGRAIAEVSAAPAVPLRVETSAPGASVALDGKPSRCATPCRLEVRPGPHAIRLTLDGYLSERRSFVARGSEVTVSASLTVASPEVSAAQWVERYGGAREIDSPASLRLLAQAVRARSLALIAADDPSPRVRLRGVLEVGGEVRARAEREVGSAAEVPPAAHPLLHELLHQGKLVVSTPLLKRPLFWIALVAAAGGAAAATYLIVHQPPTRTMLSF